MPRTRKRRSRRAITPAVVRAVDALLSAGEPAEKIAAKLHITTYVIESIRDAPTDPTKPPPPEYRPENADERDSRERWHLAEDETLVPPRRCSGCHAMIRVIPCRACRQRRELHAKGNDA